jgi:molybdopterin/thiamine biosynthesis adenylyltransferase
MDLSPSQQERYSRHLLLDGFDQEKVLQASVAVSGKDPAAHWAARYLAASGVGRLQVDEPAWHGELLALGPWLRIVASAEIVCAPTGEGPSAGALAAIETLRRVLAT